MNGSSGVVLADGEDAIEHVPKPESLTELLENAAPAGMHPELRAIVDRDAARPVHRSPDPGDEVAPVVEVEVGDRDRIDVRPAFPLSQPRQHAGAAIDEEPARCRSTMYPEWAPPGLGHAGEQPMTVNFTALYCPSWSGRYGS